MMLFGYWFCSAMPPARDQPAKPGAAWQRTHCGRLMPVGVREAAAWSELFHSAFLKCPVMLSWHCAQSPAAKLTEMALVLPTTPCEYKCWLPGPWQFSHRMLATFCTAAGMAAQLPLVNTDGNVHPYSVATSSKPPLMAKELVS